MHSDVLRKSSDNPGSYGFTYCFSQTGASDYRLTSPPSNTALYPKRSIKVLSCSSSCFISPPSVLQSCRLYLSHTGIGERSTVTALAPALILRSLPSSAILPRIAADGSRRFGFTAEPKKANTLSAAGIPKEMRKTAYPYAEQTV